LSLARADLMAAAVDSQTAWRMTLYLRTFRILINMADALSHFRGGS
jgi:hypothetical protein